MDPNGKPLLNPAAKVELGFGYRVGTLLRRSRDSCGTVRARRLHEAPNGKGHVHLLRNRCARPSCALCADSWVARESKAIWERLDKCAEGAKWHLEQIVLRGPTTREQASRKAKEAFEGGAMWACGGCDREAGVLHWHIFGYHGAGMEGRPTPLCSRDALQADLCHYLSLALVPLSEKDTSRTATAALAEGGTTPCTRSIPAVRKVVSWVGCLSYRNAKVGARAPRRAPEKVRCGICLEDIDAFEWHRLSRSPTLEEPVGDWLEIDMAEAEKWGMYDEDFRPSWARA